MNTAVVFREATIGDVPALFALPRTADGGPDPRLGAYLAGEHHPQRALAARNAYLASTAGGPVGYIAGHLTRRLDCEGELQWLYVVPQFRRAGVASGLVRLLAGWFVERSAHRVCVDVGNDVARSFYSRLGATPHGRHWMIWPDIAIVLDRPTKIPSDRLYAPV